MISKCSKLVQKEYKTRHDWVGKVIHGELCKKFKFDYMNKWYMHNLEGVLENETHKILCDFEIQTDHLVVVNRKKRTYRIVNFAISAWPYVKTEGKRKEKKVRRRCERTEKTVEHESDGDTNCNCCSWYSHQRINKGTGWLGNKRTRGDHPNYSIIKIGQNTEKCPGDLLLLKNHQLMLVWNILKRVIIIIIIIISDRAE